jgi:hypothetical protein
MGCGSGLPIGTQICVTVCVCEMVQRPSVSRAEAELQLQRMINHLEGEGKNYNRDAGGLSYRDTKWPLGQGIIPDLKKVINPGVPGYPLERSEAASALKVAEIARDIAVEGLKGGKDNIQKLHHTAKIVCPLLQAALEIVLA